MPGLLQILLALPGLIQAAETIQGGFPGQGAVKKDAVLQGISAFVGAANAAGWVAPHQQILTAAGDAIDAYVAIHNAVGAFQK